MKKWILIFLLTPMVVIAANDKTPKSFSEDFFKSIAKNEISNGYDQLFIGSTIPKDKPQAVSLLKQQTQSGLPLYGKILGYELVSEEKFGESITRLVYVLKSEKAPTTWELYFYKPKQTWFLANIIFNDQFSFLK